MNHEILIRLSEEGFDFIYSVRRGADLIESAVVGPDLVESVVVGPERRQRSEAPLGEYYGGSEATD
jgi:hypothetical protein